MTLSTLFTFASPDAVARLPNGVLSASLQPRVEAFVRAADALLLEVFTGVGMRCSPALAS
jgi:hypothetical protein